MKSLPLLVFSCMFTILSLAVNGQVSADTCGIRKIHQEIYDRFESVVYENLNPRIKKGLCFTGKVTGEESFIGENTKEKWAELTMYEASLGKVEFCQQDISLKRRRLKNWKLFKCSYELKVYQAIKYQEKYYVLYMIEGEYEYLYYLFQFNPSSEVKIMYTKTSVMY